MSCQGCKLSFCDFIKLTFDQESLITFLQDHGVISESMNCPTCNSQCKLYKKPSFRFQCNRSIKVIDPQKNCLVSRRCGFTLSARKGSLFENANLSIELICRFIACWLVFKNPRTQSLQEELKLSVSTVVQWSQFCREVCEKCMYGSERLDGEGITVEIDEVQFGERRTRNGKLTKEQWVIGGVEQGTDRCFMVAVSECTPEAFLGVIKEWILPNTTVVSDCWSSYDLDDEGFQQLAVTHSLIFVTPETEADTKNVQKMWKDARASIPGKGRQNCHFNSYIGEFMFFRKYKVHTERLHHFFKHMAEISTPTILGSQVESSCSDL